MRVLRVCAVVLVLAAPAMPAEFERVVSTELASYAQLVTARNIKVE